MKNKHIVALVMMGVLLAAAAMVAKHDTSHQRAVAAAATVDRETPIGYRLNQAGLVINHSKSNLVKEEYSDAVGGAQAAITDDKIILFTITQSPTMMQPVPQIPRTRMQNLVHLVTGERIPGLTSLTWQEPTVRGRVGSWRFVGNLLDLDGTRSQVTVVLTK